MRYYFFKTKKTIFIKIATAFISIIGIAAMPYITKMLFDYDFSKGWKGAALIVVLYFIAIAVGMIFEYISQRHSWKLGKEFNILMKQDLFDSTLSKSYKEFKMYDVSDYISIFNNDVAACEQYIKSWVGIIQTVLQLFVYGFFLFKLDYRLAILIILSSFLSLIVPKLTGNQLSIRKSDQLSGMAAYVDAIRDLLSGFRFVNNETRENISKRHKSVLEDAEEKQYHFGKFNTLTNVVTGSSMYFCSGLCLRCWGICCSKDRLRSEPRAPHWDISKTSATLFPISSKTSIMLMLPAQLPPRCSKSSTVRYHRFPLSAIFSIGLSFRMFRYLCVSCTSLALPTPLIRAKSMRSSARAEQAKRTSLIC